MKILKKILINSTTTIVTILIIGSAYAAISTVSSGDPLTADSWNQIVNKFDGIGENSVKEYVDATISANSGGYPLTKGISQKSGALNGSSNVFNYCANLTQGGFDDWRVPSTDELIRYVDTLENNSNYLFTYTPSDSSYYYAYQKTNNRFVSLVYSSTFYVYCVR